MSFRDEFIEALADADYQELAYPETVTWTHPQVGEQTCRCGLSDVASLPYKDQQAFFATPGFQDGTVRMTVHPDDTWPAVGSTCEHPRFGRLQLLAIGSESFWTQQRMGAAAWTN